MKIVHVHEDIKIIRLQDRWIIINKGVIIAVGYNAAITKQLFNDIINQELV